MVFEDQLEPVQNSSLLVQPWQDDLSEAEAQVWVLTGDGERANVGNALWAEDYLWLRVETDGQQQWLSKKIP